MTVTTWEHNNWDSVINHPNRDRLFVNDHLSKYQTISPFFMHRIIFDKSKFSIMVVEQ